MDRATKAIKRGSIRLKSYSEINLILSDLNEMRSYGKSAVKAHHLFVEDLIKWAHHEAHEGVKNTFSLLTELNLLWTEIHNEYFENLKKFRNQFELILESEQTLDKAKANLTSCEQTELKLRKRVSNYNPIAAASVEEYESFEDKLKDAKRALDFAKLEVDEKVKENQIIKLIRVKEGLKKLTESVMSLSQKCNVIMQAQKAVVNELPDEVEVNQETQFSCDRKAKQAVARAKTLIQAMGCASQPSESFAPMEYEAPPPYSPYFSVPSSSNSLRSSSRNLPSTSSLSSGSFRSERSSSNYPAWPPQASRAVIFSGGCSNEPRTYVCCNCSSQMISDHRYLLAPENTQMSPEMQLAAGLQNTRIT